MDAINSAAMDFPSCIQALACLDDGFEAVACCALGWGHKSASAQVSVGLQPLQRTHRVDVGYLVERDGVIRNNPVGLEDVHQPSDRALVCSGDAEVLFQGVKRPAVWLSCLGIHLIIAKSGFVAEKNTDCT